jgi:hypothetical protein
MRRADAKMVMITRQAIRRKLPREPLYLLHAPPPRVFL